MTHLFLASRNAHKTAEIRAILGPGWQVDDLTARADVPELPETGDTFAANAAQKALAGAAHLGGDSWVLADDSGLAVDVLGGAPGVYSARYAGPGADDEANRRKLLAELDRVGARTARPAARFHCHVAVVRGGRLRAGFDGVVEGVLVDAPRGTGGFGYDPLFVPAGEELTFAELPAATKNRLSHRARAVAQTVAFLRNAGVPAAGGG